MPRVTRWLIALAAVAVLGVFIFPLWRVTLEAPQYPEGIGMQIHVNDYLRSVDALPHHYQMHFMHAVEILGYKHPRVDVRLFWNRLYLRLVNDFHLHPETEAELDERLGDTRAGWLKRADPATIA